LRHPYAIVTTGDQTFDVEYLKYGSSFAFVADLWPDI